MNGWVRLCQDCWQELWANAYLPDEPVDDGDCDACHQYALLYGSRLKLLSTTGPSTIDPSKEDIA